MNKSFLILTITFLTNICLLAQFESRQNLEIELGSQIVFGDIDGDNDQDIVAFDEFSSNTEISWYENLTDLGGGFSSKSIIENTSYDTINTPHIIDFDQDGDNDIVILTGNSNFEQKNIIWFENLDGLGNFSNQQIILGNITQFFVNVGITIVDMDMDGDLDIFIKGTNYPNEEYWYTAGGWFRNDDNIYTYVFSYIFPYNDYSTNKITDIDGDNDLDIFYKGITFTGTKWVENDGNQDYSITHDINSGYYNYFNDIDSDGDIDVIIPESDRIFWKENNGLGDFSETQILIDNYDRGYYAKLSFNDFDKDGDLDILTNERIGEEEFVIFYENDGLNNFLGSQVLLQPENYETFKSVIDLDNDGLKDVITFDSDRNWYWYKNATILSIDQTRIQNFSAYPIPTKNNILIKSKSEIVKIEIYNNLGFSILHDLNKNYINISALDNGVYILKAKDENGNVEVIKIIKK